MTEPGPDLAAFEQEAIAFLSAHAAPRTADTSPPPERVSLFQSREAELARIPDAKRWRATKFDAGFGWITGPVALRGRGLDARYEALFDGLEAQYAVPDDECFAPGLEFVGPAIAAFGQAEAQQELVPAIFRGDLLCCQLFSEPEAGSDLASLATRAEPRGKTWEINGQKVWSSRAHVADVGLLLARTGRPEDRHRGITAFALDVHAPGVTIRPLRQMTGDAPFNEVFLDGVVIDDRYRIGPVDAGWSVAMSTLADERAAISRSERYRPGGLAELAAPARLMALAERAGRGGDPVIRAEIAQAYIRHHVTRWTVQRLRQLPPEDPAAVAAPGIGKLRLARQLTAAAEVVAGILGPRLAAQTGEGWADGWLPFVLGTPGPHIGGGTDEVILNGLGERALGLPREPRVRSENEKG